MKMNTTAQTAIEYLLLSSVVATLVFMAFARGGFMSQVHNTANEYYEDAARVIMGDNPKPINGGWCEWTPCSPGVATSYRTCECPSPAFGGSECGPISDAKKGCS